MGQGFELRLISGYQFDEVTSALQKSIRRGLEFDACYFAAIIYKSGFSNYLGRRLRVICHEDIGVANPQALILANQLAQDCTYKKNNKKYEQTQQSSDGFLQYINLIVLMCRGEKTRMGDEIANILFDGIDKGDLRIEIPNYAVDPHCDQGKQLYGEWETGTREQSHQRIKNWFNLWSRLSNEWKGSNPYTELLKKMWGYYNKSIAPIKGDRITEVNTLIDPIRKRGVLKNES